MTNPLMNKQYPNVAMAAKRRTTDNVPTTPPTILPTLKLTVNCFIT